MTQRDLTANLLAAWREAERAAAVARDVAERATEAATAADAAAKAARLAAKEAGVSLGAADIAVGKAKDAYHHREAEASAENAELERSRTSVLEPR